MVVLYSTGCPRCRMLHKLLELNDIKHEIISDISVIESKGFMEVPMLEVDGKILNYKQAMDWAKMEGKNEE